MWSAHELIVAPATVAGCGDRAVVRLAGDGLDALLPRLFRPVAAGFARPGERPRVVATQLTDDLAADWGAIDVDVLHWPGPAGPVGGPLAEAQLPGSGPLVDAVVAEACRRGARLARGGEFTLAAQEVNSFTYATLETYLPLAVGYLALTLPLAAVSRRLERLLRYEAA